MVIRTTYILPTFHDLRITLVKIDKTETLVGSAHVRQIIPGDK